MNMDADLTWVYFGLISFLALGIMRQRYTWVFLQMYILASLF